MIRSESDERCPLMANQWPTYTRADGLVELREPRNPRYCRGLYYLPPASSRPHDSHDPATEETEVNCPLDNPRQCPHWAERMDRYGERLGIPPRSRNANVEDLPGDIADHTIVYLRSVVSNVDDGRNVAIVGPVGAGKTCTAGLVLVTYARLAETDSVRFIGADPLFQLLATLCQGPDWARDERWDALVEAPLLVIDDLGTELATSGAVRNWVKLIDERYQAGRATIITTNAADLDEVFHDGRARSRFMANGEVWRTGRGDMRGVAATPISEPEGGGADDAGADAEAMAACLPRPRTPDEWETVAAEIGTRPNPSNTDLAYLLADHGIPAVATFRFRQPDSPEAECLLRDLLVRIGRSDKHHHLLDAIAWRSHDHGFDYAEDFHIVDWRERFADVPWSDEARIRYGIPTPEADRLQDQE